MQNFDLTCDDLRKAGFRISYWKHYSRGSFVWLENNSLKLFIYKEEWKVFVTGKKTQENWSALWQIRQALAPTKVTVHLA